MCAAAYLAVLGLLTLVERGDPNASIRTFTDAFWYSLVTISTVGYGDLYPVTTPGKLLGAVFIILSLGFLTTFYNSFGSNRVLCGLLWL